MGKDKKQDCFIIMPISDPDDYEEGHFKRVYEDIIIPACEKAEYNAIRSDDIEETDMIHISILKKIVEAPMAICDLSNKNPNVLFELGLRQAFDKPVVLIQEEGTDRIFDVSILRAYDYCKELKYNEVLKDQENIAKMLKGTEKSFVTGEGFNSVIKLLSLSNRAQVKNIDDPNEELRMQLFQVSSQLDDISSELHNMKNKDNRRSVENVLNFSRFDIKRNLLNDFDEFLYHYKRRNLEKMNKIYKEAINSKINSPEQKKILDTMRVKISELKNNIED